MIEHLPLLHVQRALCERPRGMGRFREYLRTMIDDSGQEVRLPLAVFNPMAKEHVAELLDRLVNDDYESVVVAAIADATQRLGRVAPPMRVGLVVADDAKGGWTHRATTDFSHRFDNRGELRRGFATVLLWSADEPSPEAVRRDALATIYRATFRKFHRPDTLGGLMRQEGMAAVFAGSEPGLDDETIAKFREVIDPHRDSRDYAVQLPCLYGDRAAREVGHDPLGLPDVAGFDLAATEAHREGLDPLTALAIGSR